MRLQAALILACLLWAGCQESPVSPIAERAHTYHVNGSDPHATDANDGLFGSWNATARGGPFKTIARAMQALEPGDVAYVHAGVYEEFDLRFRHTGVDGAPITLSAFPQGDGFEHVVIDGGGAPDGAGGIEIDRDQGYVVLQGLDIKNMPRAGIATDGSTSHPGLAIRNTVVQHNGIGIRLAAANGFEIVGVWADENDEEGILLLSSDQGSILDTEASGNRAGFRLVSSSSNRFERNLARDNAVVGVQLESSSNDNSLIDNVGARNRAEDGFTVIGSFGNVLTGNEAHGNGKRGFQLTGGSGQNVVESNIAHDNDVLGFAIYVESTGNTMRANGSYRNRFHGFVFLAGATGNTVAENMSYDNCRCGFYMENASGNDFLDNSAHDNLFDGFTLFLGSRDNRFSNNSAERNTGWGFLADFDSPNGDLAADNAARANGSGSFGEIEFESVDFAAYTDISDPWDCRRASPGQPR